MNKIKPSLLLSVLLMAQPLSGFAAVGINDQGTNNQYGVWGTLQMEGDFKAVSPSLSKFNWLIMDQSRTRDDNSAGTRLTENLLFGQVGYQLNTNATVVVGYVHDWIHTGISLLPNQQTNPVQSPTNFSYQESRPYQDFVWRQALGNFGFMSRTRFEERINETSGDTGYRGRQLLQISHPLPIKNLSAYLGDETLYYANQNSFGRQGFSENRALTGLSYQFTPAIGFDLGYLGQYVVQNTTVSANKNNLFTHNVQANLRFRF